MYCEGFSSNKPFVCLSVHVTYVAVHNLYILWSEKTRPFYYRAMHFSAKRGIAIACRLSVYLSVCLSETLVDCDHIGWNTSEIISHLVSLGCPLSADPNIMGLLQGKHPRIWTQSDPPPVDLSVGDIR